MKLELLNEDWRNWVSAGAAAAAIGLGANEIYKSKSSSPKIATPPPIVAKEQPRPTQLTRQGRISTQDYMDFIEPHEGRRSTAYKDTMGHATVGVGFNLDKSGAARLLQAVGADYSNVLNGAQLTDQQIDSLFETDTENAIRGARSSVSNFDTLPNNVKKVVVDMVFNMGTTKFQTFRRMITALERNDYQAAADEMVNSRWYRQVGNRSRRLVKMMRNLP